MATGRLHHVVLDCPDPGGLAVFWSELLGQQVTFRSDDWVVVAERENTSGMAFQLAPDHQPPVWGDPSRPQQVHVDVMVDEVSTAEAQVEKLGARRLTSGEGSVWADPAGHPFCLIPRPPWAPPVGD
ncbi:MAG: glyoxalase [Actinomycetota bacterium]|nr:glyoxalase [Actinomycetota bacterium]